MATDLNINQDEKFIRIKPYLHILENGGLVQFIKTLDDGTRLPAGEFFNGFMKCILDTPNENELIHQLFTVLKLSPGSARQLLDKLFELGVIEYVKEMPPSMNRYHRQLLFFDSIDPRQHFSENESKQKKLGEAHIMIIGIGGIGNFISLALTAAGTGKISLVDFDTVEETNLNRQVLFGEPDIGKSKTEVAASRLKQLNSSCMINCYENNIASAADMEAIILKAGSPDYIILSADKPVDLVLWASALCRKHNFKYLKCGYMAYQGLIGPLLGPDTRPYEQIFQSWSDNIKEQPGMIRTHNESHIAASMAASNAVLANIAALEIIKDITGIIPSLLIEKRLLLNFKTMELTYG